MSATNPQQPCKHSCQFGAIHRSNDGRLIFDCEKCGERVITEYYFKASLVVSEPDDSLTGTADDQLWSRAEVDVMRDITEPAPSDRPEELGDALEAFRLWLAGTGAFTNCGISNELPTTVLTIARGRIEMLESELARLRADKDKVAAFNLLLTAVNATIRILAERYLEGVKDMDAFVEFLRTHPLDAARKAKK